jgi:NAD(P)-dependent dehydrogenase (short-subunit alcohol dehydrogenase family)
MTQMAIVTGGASGIGKAVGAALAGRGVDVILADIDADAAKLAAESLTEPGDGRVSGIELDVRDAAAVNDVIEEAVDRHGRIDFMFNNAGTGVGGPVEMMQVAHWDRVIDVNLRGVVHGVQAAYPVMVRQGFGHIVNTASLAGLTANPGIVPYATTKWAVVGLSLSLRGEAVEHGVNVSAVCPSLMDTPLLDRRNPVDLPPVQSAAPDMRSVAGRIGLRIHSPDRLAQDILRGMDRNKALIVAPRDARMLWRVARWAPGLSLRLSQANHRKMRRLAEELS